jgi:choline kinase
MKAIILAAGVGSRLRPLTNTKPKSLIPVAGKPILQRILESLEDVGIPDILIITGYEEKQLKTFVKKMFPHLSVQFITNKKYESTNTGYSLLLARDFINSDDFIKFDADVVFEKAILEKLINSSSSALCIDKNIHLEAEEVKVTTDKKANVLSVGKKIDGQTAQGESIGIEKLTKEAGEELFSILDNLMKNPKHYQDYYDDSYTTLVKKGLHFIAVDVTGNKWVEIDTLQDYKHANLLFDK